VSEDSTDLLWYTVRCVFQSESDEGFLYEERLTLWQAKSFEDAISLAESEAAEYAQGAQIKYLGLAQACVLADSEPPTSGAEVFSLVRDSDLAPKDYLDRFFDTGRERQSHWQES
jgi:hypothetical protein